MSLTYVDVQKAAKICGFTFKRLGTGYILITPYGEHKRTTLREINSLIMRDHKRFTGSRF